MPLLGRDPVTLAFRELEQHPGDDTVPGVVVLRLDGGLFFATADAVEDRIRELVLSTPPIRCIVVDCQGVNFVDSQGAAKLQEIVELCTGAGVVFRMSHVKPDVRALLARDGVLELIGGSHIHDTIPQAVEAQTATGGASQCDNS